MTVEVFAPAKINLTLHVTGRRADGYHLLDSLVAFADVGDSLRLSLADRPSLTVTGPMAAGVPEGPENLCLRAAAAFGAPAAIALDKRLPAASGIGGGSADAAAVLRGLAALTGRAFAGDAATLGADVPVCLDPRPSRMRGVGEDLTPLSLPDLPAVLVNPGVPVATPRVFAGLARRDSPPMPGALPRLATVTRAISWIADQRNDLEPPARALAPEIGQALAALAATDGCRLARMSGSGATSFGLFETPAAATRAAAALTAEHPTWWIAPCRLGDQSRKAAPAPL